MRVCARQGYQLVHAGTAQASKEAGIQVAVVNKVKRGPHVVDLRKMVIFRCNHNRQ